MTPAAKIELPLLAYGVKPTWPQGSSAPGFSTDQVLEENERLLDNQDLAFLLKVSFRTLQRYRLKGKLPYFTIGHKTYYRASDIRAFVRERADYQTYKQFEKANQLENKL